MSRGFIQGFIKRDGAYILIATILARILSFLASWIALKLLSNFGLGLVIYALNIILMIIPISGLGASQGLLRFGALYKSEKEKINLFAYVLKKGTLFSLIIIVIILILSPLLTFDMAASKPYLIMITFQILTIFLMESLKTQFRVLHQNKTFAFVDITYSILLVISVFLGSWFFKETGYVMAMVLTPLITFLLYIRKIPLNIKNINPFEFSIKAFWKYSFYTGLSNVATQLLIVLDIILIGQILNDPEKVTLYKYLSLIPFSLLFLPRVLLLTDFVNLTQNHKKKEYINNYIKNYISFFSMISVLIIILSLIFKRYILHFFGEEFINYGNTFFVLIIGISAVLSLRGLFGNLLSVIGKAYINYWISIIAILINLITNFILIPRYGILGAAITSAIIMWFTSILSVFAFYHYYKKI
jgi:O-antigen/teichoic acid export membrane protein